MSRAAPSSPGWVNPTGARTGAEFGRCLEEVLRRAGVSKREASARSTYPMSRSLIYNFIDGELPRKAQYVTSLLTVANVPEREHIIWLATWHRLRDEGSQEPSSTRSPGGQSNAKVEAA